MLSSHEIGTFVHKELGHLKNLYNKQGQVGRDFYTLGLFYWPAAGSRLARPGKTAAAAAVTPSTQGGNEHQTESLE